MADNFTTDGTGAVPSKTFAADEIGGVLHPRTKVEFGADGAVTDVSSGSPLPVDLSTMKKLEDDPHASGDAGLMALVVRKDTAAALAGADGDYIPLIVDSSGRLHVNAGSVPAAARTSDSVSSALAVDRLMQNLTALTPNFAVIDHATSGDNTIVSAQGTGNMILVHQLFLVAAAAVTIRFEGGAGGTGLTGQMQVAANSGFVLPFSPIGWFRTAANVLLNLELSGAVSADGVLGYSVVT